MASFITLKAFDGVGGKHELLINSDKIIGMRLLRVQDLAKVFPWADILPQYIIVVFVDGLPTTIGLSKKAGQEDDHPFKYAHIMSIISEESKKDKAERNVQMVLDDDEEDFKAMLWEQWKLDHPVHDHVELFESQQKFDEAHPELLKKFAEQVREQWEEQSLEQYAHELYRAVSKHLATLGSLPYDDKAPLNG